jgi:carbonic anhydrase
MRNERPQSHPRAVRRLADLPAIKFDYKPAPLKVIDNGHAIQVNYAPGPTQPRNGRAIEATR